jgi:hypothetical protein
MAIMYAWTVSSIYVYLVNVLSSLKLSAEVRPYSYTILQDRQFCMETLD